MKLIKLDIAISSLHVQRLKAYLEKIRKKPLSMGNRLYNVLRNSQLKSITVNDLIDALLKTKNPLAFAENEAHLKADGTDWSKEEVQLLGGITPFVKELTAKYHKTFEPTERDTIENAQANITMAFTNGLLLAGSACDEELILDDDPDISKRDSCKRIDSEKYQAELERRLLPMLLAMNEDAKDGFVLSTPTLGAGQFSGEYTKIIRDFFPLALKNIIKAHGNQLTNLRGILYDAFSREEMRQLTSPEKFTIAKGDDGTKIPYLITYAQHPQLPGLFKKPNEVFSAGDHVSEKTKILALTAADHVSWPGNDSYANLSSTAEGGMSIITDLMPKLIGRGCAPVKSNNWKTPLDTVIDSKFHISLGALWIDGENHQYESSEAYKPTCLTMKRYSRYNCDSDFLYVEKQLTMEDAPSLDDLIKIYRDCEKSGFWSCKVTLCGFFGPKNNLALIEEMKKRSNKHKQEGQAVAEKSASAYTLKHFNIG